MTRNSLRGLSADADRLAEAEVPAATLIIASFLVPLI